MTDPNRFNIIGRNEKDIRILGSEGEDKVLCITLSLSLFLSLRVLLVPTLFGAAGQDNRVQERRLSHAVCQPADGIHQPSDTHRFNCCCAAAPVRNSYYRRDTECWSCPSCVGNSCTGLHKKNQVELPGENGKDATFTKGQK